MRRQPIEIVAVDAVPTDVEADVLAVTVTEPATLSNEAKAVDQALDGRLAHLVADGEVTGTTGRVTLVHTRGELGSQRVAVVGIGAEEAVEADTLRTAAARVAARAAHVGGGTVAWTIGGEGRLGAAERARAIVDGTVLTAYDPGAWKTNGERQTPVTRLVLVGQAAPAAGDAAARAGVVAEWTNRCRELVDMPANELTPERLAAAASDIADGSDQLRFDALGPREIAGAGMGAFAGVASGSAVEPRLVILEYSPPTAGEVHLGLVGKAITFDSGGLSLKPSRGMDEMKTDMAGGAAVLAATGAIAALGIPVRVTAVVPACENMPDGRAYRPGDILTALNGKTIEVTNTDAEGRLVLADALVDARRRGATHVLDLATLTGSVVIALGDFYAGLLGNDQAWVDEVEAAGAASGDHAWPLPLHETYARYIKSTYADMKNSSDLRQAGPIYAARFLQEFAGDGPWAHLDIAGTAYLERSRGDYYTSKGSTGFGVRLIAALAERLA